MVFNCIVLNFLMCGLHFVQQILFQNFTLKALINYVGIINS